MWLSDKDLPSLKTLHFGGTSCYSCNFLTASLCIDSRFFTFYVTDFPSLEDVIIGGNSFQFADTISFDSKCGDEWLI